MGGFVQGWAALFGGAAVVVACTWPKAMTKGEASVLWQLYAALARKEHKQHLENPKGRCPKAEKARAGLELERC